MMLGSYTVKNVIVVNLYQSVIVNCKLDAGLYIVVVPRKYLSPIFELFPPTPMSHFNPKLKLSVMFSLSVLKVP